MGLKQRFSKVLIGIRKAVGGLAILGLMCGALSLSADAQAVVATLSPLESIPEAAMASEPESRTRSTSRTTRTVTATPVTAT